MGINAQVIVLNVLMELFINFVIINADKLYYANINVNGNVDNRVLNAQKIAVTNVVKQNARKNVEKYVLLV